MQENPRTNSQQPRLIVAFFFGLCLASYLCAPVYNPDIFSHLIFGRFIHSTMGGAPTTDIWTQFGSDKPWLSSSTLFDYAIASFESFFGLKGMLIFKLVSFCLIVLSLILSLFLLSGSIFFGSFLAAIIASAIFEAGQFGVTELSYLYLPLQVTVLYQLQSKKFRLPLVLLIEALLFAALANTHLSAIFVLPALIVLAFSILPTLQAAVLAATLVLAGLIGPYFGGQLLFTLKNFTGLFSANFYGASGAPTIYNYSFSGMLILLTLLLSMIGRNYQVLKSVEVLLVGTVVLTSFASSHVVGYGLISLGLCMAVVWQRLDGSSIMQGIFGGLNKLAGKLSKFPALGSAWVLLCMAIVNVFGELKAGILEAHLPKAELEYLVKQPNLQPLLHESTIGGYVIYKFSDESGAPKLKAAFDDERLFYFRPDYAYLAAKFDQLRSGWDELLSEVEPRSIIVKRGTPAFKLLSSDQRFQEVENTELGVLENSENPESGKNVIPARLWALFTLRS